MALPTRANVLTMDYSGDGSPHALVAAKSGIDLDGLDWSLIGSPWWGLEETAAGNIEAVATVTWANLGKIATVSKANVAKVAGIDAT